MLEASDAENLLDKFEDASNQANDLKMNESSNDSEPRSPGRLKFSKSSQDPQKKSQIIAAVQNHFSISSSNDTTPNTIDTNSIGKRPPRIGTYTSINKIKCQSKCSELFQTHILFSMHIIFITSFSSKPKNKRCSSSRNY